MATATQTSLKVADEVWIATALLHRDHPEAQDFAVKKLSSARSGKPLHRPLRRGVYVHVIQHCVANRPPDRGRYRMLLEADARPAAASSARGIPTIQTVKAQRSHLEREDLPNSYNGLFTWYRDWSAVANTTKFSKQDPLLLLRGSGKRLWAGEHADDYVRRLREGWE